MWWLKKEKLTNLLFRCRQRAYHRDSGLLFRRDVISGIRLEVMETRQGDTHLISWGAEFEKDGYRTAIGWDSRMEAHGEFEDLQVHRYDNFTKINEDRILTKDSEGWWNIEEKLFEGEVVWFRERIREYA